MTEQLGAQLLASQELICTFLGILLWDTLATLPCERRHIWKQKWSLLKGSYLINRYWTVIAQSISCSMMLGHIPASTCDRAFWIVMLNATSIIVVCDFIIAIRVWAVWERTRRMGIILLSCLIVELLLMVFSAWQLKPVSLPTGLANLVNWHGCSAGNPTTASRKVVALLFWTPTLLFNAACLALIFVRHVQLSRTSNKLPILERLLRDGMFYFLVIVVTDIPNMVFCALDGQPGLDSIFAIPSFTIKSLMCSRMVLGLLETGSQGLVAMSEKKRSPFALDTTAPPWWSPPTVPGGVDDLSAQQKKLLAQRRQTLPNLSFNYAFVGTNGANTPDKNIRERRRPSLAATRGPFHLAPFEEDTTVPPSSSLASFGSSGSSTSGGAVSWAANSFAPTLVNSAGRVRVDVSSESVVTKSRRSNSLPEEDV